MRSIYLPLRILGDFIITASVVKNNFNVRIPTILPSYLEEIYKAINGDDYFEIVDTIDYSTQPAFFELYKVKNLHHSRRLVKDLYNIYSHVNKKDQYILDYSSRRLLFTGANFKWPSKSENIYEGKFKLFSEHHFLDGHNMPTDLIKPIEAGKTPNVLILPDSRISAKCIDNKIIGLITDKLSTGNVNIANFSKQKPLNSNNLHYSNFDELIQLISAHDLVISAESLPYHFANYLNKPHFVIYNKSRHFKSSFMTPFMLKNKYYSMYNGNNANQVANDVCTILLG